MKLDIIENWQDVRALQPEWNALLRHSRADTIFLTWEWVEAWRRVAGEQVRPFVVTVRNEEGTLLGLIPFYLAELRLLHAIPYRTLRIMGDYAAGAEYPGWIARADREAEVLSLMATTLSAARAHWDCIWMPNMAGWNGAHQQIIQACQAAGYYCHLRSREFSAIDLPDSMDVYMNRLSPKMRSQVRRQTRKILEHDKIAIVRCRTAEELPTFLDALFELHHRRWKQKGKEGTFRRRPVQALFYQEFTKIALENKWLRLSGLQEDGAFKAVQIGYVYNHVFHSLQEGFDPDYIDGAGIVLRVKVIEACVAEGIRSYDFLGGVTEHKKRWLAKQRIGYDLFIGHQSLRNRILFAKRVWPTGRFLRPVNLPSPVLSASSG